MQEQGKAPFRLYQLHEGGFFFGGGGGVGVEGRGMERERSRLRSPGTMPVLTLAIASEGRYQRAGRKTHNTAFSLC